MLIEESGKLVCKGCTLPIEKNQKKFYSRQAGMQGWYHWDCYKVKVRDVNERGKKELTYSGATESVISAAPPDPTGVTHYHVQIA